MYDRPLADGARRPPGGGGRVTELVARPLLNLHWPQLAGFVQPLAGEYAARRHLLERLPFATGYGVEIALLIDALDAVGLDAMAQVDLGERRHRHHDDLRLGRMAAEIWQTALARLHQDGDLQTVEPTLTQFVRDASRYLPVTHDVTALERPPAPDGGRRRAGCSEPMTPILYSDLDGTMVGPGGCFVRAADGSTTLDPTHALVALHDAGVSLVAGLRANPRPAAGGRTHLRRRRLHRRDGRHHRVGPRPPFQHADRPDAGGVLRAAGRPAGVARPGRRAARRARGTPGAPRALAPRARDRRDDARQGGRRRGQQVARREGLRLAGAGRQRAAERHA